MALNECYTQYIVFVVFPRLQNIVWYHIITEEEWGVRNERDEDY